MINDFEKDSTDLEHLLDSLRFFMKNMLIDKEDISEYIDEYNEVLGKFSDLINGHKVSENNLNKEGKRTEKQIAESISNVFYNDLELLSRNREIIVMSIENSMNMLDEIKSHKGVGLFGLSRCQEDRNRIKEIEYKVIDDEEKLEEIELRISDLYDSMQ